MACCQIQRKTGRDHFTRNTKAKLHSRTPVNASCRCAWYQGKLLSVSDDNIPFDIVSWAGCKADGFDELVVVG